MSFVFTVHVLTEYLRDEFIQQLACVFSQYGSSHSNSYVIITSHVSKLKLGYEK